MSDDWRNELRCVHTDPCAYDHTCRNHRRVADLVAAKDEKIAALEAEVQRLNDIVIGFMGDGTESPDLAPFVALAQAAEQVLAYWGAGEMEHDYPRGQLKELRQALAHPTIQRAVA